MVEGGDGALEAAQRLHQLNLHLHDEVVVVASAEGSDVTPHVRWSGVDERFVLSTTQFSHL